MATATQTRRYVGKRERGREKCLVWKKCRNHCQKWCQVAINWKTVNINNEARNSSKEILSGNARKWKFKITIYGSLSSNFFYRVDPSLSWRCLNVYPKKEVNKLRFFQSIQIKILNGFPCFFLPPFSFFSSLGCARSIKYKTPSSDVEGPLDFWNIVGESWNLSNSERRERLSHASHQVFMDHW